MYVTALSLGQQRIATQCHHHGRDHACSPETGANCTAKHVDHTVLISCRSLISSIQAVHHMLNITLHVWARTRAILPVHLVASKQDQRGVCGRADCCSNSRSCLSRAPYPA